MNPDELKNLINKLEDRNRLDYTEWETLFSRWEDSSLREYAAEKANALRKTKFGNKIFIRGLIEFSNYCRNDCFYCGIRRSNPNAERYRLGKAEILEACSKGYALGFRTFVLQSGEDLYFTDEKMADIIKEIKRNFPDCALTLSIGEKTGETYEKYKNAGADRFLLRHETADKAHYEALHPRELSFETRIKCLETLKALGFQTGCGLMVGSPFQTAKTLAKDMVFMQEFRPHMVGIGPFISQHDTPFRDCPNGSVELTLFILSLTRLMLPDANIPATTALGSLDERGRERGILSGANVVMPNLSPMDARDRYNLYDNKLRTGAEAGENLRLLSEKLKKIGCEICVDRGDFKIR